MKHRIFITMVAIFVGISVLMAAFAEDGSFFLDGVMADYLPNHNVTIDGVPHTVYCLQHNYPWPEADTPYKLGDPRTDGFMSEAQLLMLQKLLYAGYPYDVEDFSLLAEQYSIEEFGSAEYAEYIFINATENAVWTLTQEWGLTGNTEHVYSDPITEALLAFAKDSSKVLQTPPEGEWYINITGSGKMTKQTDGTYKSGKLEVDQPANYKLHFTLNLPSGVIAVDANGNTVLKVTEGQPFYLIANSPEVANGKTLLVTSSFTYPGDVNYIIPQKEFEPGKPYQTMLSLLTKSSHLTGRLVLSASDAGGDEPETGDSTNIGLLIMLMAMSAGGSVMILKKKNLLQKNG